MRTHIALLRGINVGGNHKLPMKDLMRIFIDSGASNVTTFIQSGNVIFDSEISVANEIALSVEGKIASQFGFQAPVILRTAERMKSVINSSPLPEAIEGESKIYVMFLKDKPSTESVQKLDKLKFLPDLFEVVGQEIFIHYAIGAGKSKLTNAYFDKTLGTISTSRNWRTTNALAELGKRK